MGREGETYKEGRYARVMIEFRFTTTSGESVKGEDTLSASWLLALFVCLQLKRSFLES